MKTIFLIHFAFLLFVIPNIGWAQIIAVTGYVNDGVNGDALKNVSVFETNSKIGTITNENGFYKLMLEKGQFDLRISDNGFKPYSKILELNSDTTLLVKLQPVLHVKQRNKKGNELHAGVDSDKKSNNRSGFKLF